MASNNKPLPTNFSTDLWKIFYRFRILWGLHEVFSLVVKIKAEDCVGCGACEDVCPQSAIKVTDVAIIDEKECVDCGACIDECPNACILQE
jgi:ferredoxin